MSPKIRTMTILICLSACGILIFQAVWLYSSYKISREKLRDDMRNTLNYSINKLKILKADTACSYLSSVVESEKDFNSKIHATANLTPDEMAKIAIQNKETNIMLATFRLLRLRGQANTFLIDMEKAKALRNSSKPAMDARAALLGRIKGKDLDGLKALYGSVRSFLGSNDQERQQLDEKMAGYFYPYDDTMSLNHIINDNFKKRRLDITGRVSYYFDISGTWLSPPNGMYERIPKRPSAKQPAKTSLIKYTADLSFHSPISPDQYQANLEYRHKLEEKHDLWSDSLHASARIADYAGETWGRVSAVLVLSAKASTFLLLKNMLISINASMILLLFLALCMLYMYRLIMSQRKLADIKNDFVSNISHELKTPIATTLAAVQGMQHFDVLKDEQKTKQYLNTASAELNRLTMMVDKILNISIFESAEFTLNPVIFNLQEMMKEIVTTQELKQLKPVEISLKYNAEEEIFADRAHLQNVIVNLIDNAIKYSDAPVKIDIECKNAPGGIELNITDNGPGIDKEYQASVFEKFFRVPSPGDHSIKGHGLGLHYVKNIVEKHGGGVGLYSDASGSTFTIYLPYGSA